MKGYRVWAEIDLSALRHNIALIRRTIGPRPRILAVVKADAYGHGALAVAQAATEAGCEMLGVGDSGEAIELREAGLTAPLLILGAIVEEEIPAVVRHDVSVTVHSTDLLPLLEAEARRHGRLLRVHLKVDTGLSRLGAPPARARDVARAIVSSPHLRLEGLSTHLAAAADADASRAQLDLFRAVIGDLTAEGIDPGTLHAANSVGLFNYPEAHFDMVRPGIALYGLDPGPFARQRIALRPVLSLRTRIAFVKRVPAGTAVGYDGRWRAPAATRLATCPAGYNDGYPWPLARHGEAALRGRRVPVVGAVSMDYVTLDIGAVPDAEVGDEVTLIGDGIRVEELARRIGTIPYEITCGLGRRVKRVAVNVDPATAAGFRVVA